MNLLTHWQSERSVFEQDAMARVGFCVSLSEPVTKKVTYEPTIRLGYLNNAKHFRTETQDSINEEAIRWATDR